MHLINNNVFADLENFLDISLLDTMHDQIIRAIAKNEEYIVPSYTTHSTFYDKTLSSYVDKRGILNKYHDMTDKQKNWYAKLDTSATLGHHMLLRDISGYPHTYRYKHLSEFIVNMPCANDFEFLFDWIKNQGCFLDYGRVMFWIAEPGQKTTMHTDYGNYNSNNRDMFIWITGINPKQLVVLDTDTGNEITSTTRACTFNSNNWHCGKGHQHYTSWSLRIDGVFNPDWARRAGINEFYNIK